MRPASEQGAACRAALVPPATASAASKKHRETELGDQGQAKLAGAAQGQRDWLSARGPGAFLLPRTLVLGRGARTGSGFDRLRSSNMAWGGGDLPYSSLV